MAKTPAKPVARKAAANKTGGRQRGAKPAAKAAARRPVARPAPKAVAKPAVKASVRRPLKPVARPGAKRAPAAPTKKAAKPAATPVAKPVAKAAARPKTAAPAPSAPGCPPGSPGLIPTLVVRTAEAAIDFYRRAFGFAVDFTMPGPNGAIAYAQLRHERSFVHLMPEGAYGSVALAPVHAGNECPAALYLYCADVDAMIDRARLAGARVLSEPADMFWGDRVGSLVCCEGYRWTFATWLGEIVAPPSADFAAMP